MNEKNEKDDMVMRLYGRSTVSKFLGDFIIYRGLNPCDERLPGFAECASAVGLEKRVLPRKHEDNYARLVVHLLKIARRLEIAGSRIKRLIYLGDTRLSDATAFHNLCLAGGWDGLAFICSEECLCPAALLAEETEKQGENCRRLYAANRWNLLSEFNRLRHDLGFVIDEETAVVVDLDKTAIGARGRNSSVIDRARQLAVQETVAGLLEDAFELTVFQEAYAALDKPEYHAFTEDNQDYLAYICLALGSGSYKLKDVIARVRSGELVSFGQFIAWVEEGRRELPKGFRALHADFFGHMKAGDPTPFKAFRCGEYRLTAARLGWLPDNVPLAHIMANEIVITWEVHEVALEWKAAGALIFGLSDKPDEASLPTPEQISKGCLPLHRIETHLVGASIDGISYMEHHG